MKYIKYLSLIFLLIQQINAMAQKPNYVGDYLPDSTVLKIYEDFQETCTSRAVISKLSNVTGSNYNGVYTFRLGYQPHYPTKVFVIYMGNTFVITNLGYLNIKGVVAEMNKILYDIKANKELIHCIYLGIYKYLIEEYGLDYGNYIKNNSKPSFDNDSQKMKYIKSKIFSMNDIITISKGLSLDQIKCFEDINYYILKDNLNDEETIILLNLLLLK